MTRYSAGFIRRQTRVRAKLRRSMKKSPSVRLTVFRSNQHIYAQMIDDAVGKTLVSVSTLDAALRSKTKAANNQKAAEEVGKHLARAALKVGIKEVVFDRGGYLYHGRIKALAMGARAEGLVF